jgi:hypothetical protein
MKKYLLSISAIVLTAGILVFTGCKKDDATAPVIKLNGGDQTISLQGTYTELGATATDDKDGAITPTVSGTVDVNKTGVYVITYSATDAAGNAAEETRNVTVKNDAEASWAGTYKGKETDANGPYDYHNDVIVTASTTINNQIIVNPLGDFKNNAVYMNVVGTTISIPNQNHTNVGSPQIPSDPCDVHNRQTSSGTGAKTATGFTLNYSDAKITPCSGTRVSVNATFTKQ